MARHALAAQWRAALREEPLPDPDAPGSADIADDDAASPETLLVQTQEGHAVWRALRGLADFSKPGRPAGKTSAPTGRWPG